jgi:outer membrane biosynthesis protein TonB
VKSGMYDCRDQFPDVKGTVKLKVTVAQTGFTTDVQVVETPDDVLGACVAKALKRAKYPETQNGGTFKWPFML